MITNKKLSKYLFNQIFLIIISSILFMLANPNFLVKEGLGFLAYFIYLPVLFIIKKASLKDVWLFGGIYGGLAYALYGYWLQSFHPLGLIIVVIAYILILALVFFCLKIIDLLFKKNAWLVQWLFIGSYEYLKTLGFAGFNYGVTAYTQWKYLYLIQICDICGVFIFNLFVILPSAIIFSLINKNQQKNMLMNNLEISNEKSENLSNTSAFLLKEKKMQLNSRRLPFICSLIWLILLFVNLIYGITVVNRKENKKYITVAAIQNNESPWENGINEYQKNVRNLIQLSDEAIEMNPDVKLVVWPETSVVPSIMYNYYEKPEINRYKLVLRLLDYFNSSNASFLIGNAHQVPDFNKSSLEKYNSAFFFEPGKNVIPPQPGIYSKMKLVPFSEEFPYDTQFPWLYKKLLNGDLHMWQKGNEYKTFELEDLKFSTPICFEDTFDFIGRNMVLNGSRCFVNLSNDSWSNSISCQYQHLAMAVFRSVENKVPAVRSTSSGKTCIINENGKIEASMPDFCCGYVVGKIPVLDDDFKITLFTKYGDFLINLEIGFLILILIIQVIRVIIQKYVRKVF